MKKGRAVLSILLALTFVFSSFMCMTFVAQAEDSEPSPINEYGKVENIEGGNILHCWCWSFENIRKNMKTIADAGYSAVQTSPINAVYAGENGGMQLYGKGKWYYQYQPTDYTIGNYQLGTEEEFKTMCSTAHSYGVKVIVDIVANHTTPTKSAVSSTLLNIEGGLYHPSPTSNDLRYRMTQTYDGLPDINTQNPNYQQLILNFLKKCISDGADGFRYDTAKHIELPDDDPSYAGDFWPTVLDNGSKFQYGEVLQSPTNSAVDRFTDYAKIMHITASTHGGTIRNYFLNGCKTTLAVSFSGYNSLGVKGDRLVTWVESHDTYANNLDANDSESSFWLTNDQIRRGWALIGSRRYSTSLFFSRPYGSEATEDEDRYDNPRWGINQIGAAGDDNYFHPEVVAVNKFRNAMYGEKEKLENIEYKTKAQYIMVTRGTRGAVIINNSDYDLVLDKAFGQETTIADGTYTDAAHGAQFVASAGKLYGTVKAKEVAVIYDDPSLYTTTVPEEYTVPTEPATTAPVTTIKLSAAKSTIYVGASTTVKATVTNKVGTTTFTSSNTKVATVSSAGKVVGKKSGTVTITAKNNGKSASVKIKVIKKNQSMTVKASTKTVKYSKVKKSKQTVSPITVKNAKGTVKYKKTSGSAKLSVTSKGKIVVKKGTKKGTYKATVQVTAAGNTTYNSSKKSVKVTVKVK